MRRTPLTPNPANYSPEQLARNSSLPIAHEVEWRREKRPKKSLKQRLKGDDGYSSFSKAMRQKYPNCQIRWEGVCTGRSEGVHHVIKRSQGGALVPGEVAELQGQVFMAACNACNKQVEYEPAKARKRGLVKSNPLRKTGLMETSK